MKTKIIYISGNEVFDMCDIRAAFEEVRMALNLDKNTVLFGVPVDADDACLMNKSETINEEKTETISVNVNLETNTDSEKTEENTPVLQTTINEETPEIPVQEVDIKVQNETPVSKKRGRPRKEEIVTATTTQDVQPQETEDVQQIDKIDDNKKTIPILSVLSADKEPENESVDTTEVDEEIDIIPEITDDASEEIDNKIDSNTDSVQQENSEPDLEKLLSEMTPLQEDVMDESLTPTVSDDAEEDNISVDVTLEQLATEFAEAQDKIHSEQKTSSRSRIGKLRNILPFKQSKHKDQGIGDLLEWAGIAANDEDFSVPGFFTNVASKK